MTNSRNADKSQTEMRYWQRGWSLWCSSSSFSSSSPPRWPQISDKLSRSVWFTNLSGNPVINVSKNYLFFPTHPTMAGYCVEKHAAHTFLILGSSKCHPNICTSALSIVTFSCSTFVKKNLYHKKPSDESSCEGIASWAAVSWPCCSCWFRRAELETMKVRREEVWFNTWCQNIVFKIMLIQKYF